jgi:hypothetical protein
MACLLNFTPEQRQELQDPELITLADEVRGRSNNSLDQHAGVATMQATLRFWKWH